MIFGAELENDGKVNVSQFQILHGKSKINFTGAFENVRGLM
jgi:hypothetical protein